MGAQVVEDEVAHFADHGQSAASFADISIQHGQALRRQITQAERYKDVRIVEEDPKDRDSQSSGGDMSVLGSQYSKTKINREIRAQAAEGGVTTLCRLKSQRHSTGVVEAVDIVGGK